MRKNEPLIDRLPEFIAYRDVGCDLYSSCLACPLPRCRYDDPGWMQREERGQRDTEILRTRVTEALPVVQLAARFGVSTRTVHRIIKRSGDKVRVLAAS
ncbi:MAG: sigma factor-like helix-turn-helix DNA-binding protein [Dehalococcoidia bacterium]